MARFVQSGIPYPNTKFRGGFAMLSWHFSFTGASYSVHRRLAANGIRNMECAGIQRKQTSRRDLRPSHKNLLQRFRSDVPGGALRSKRMGRSLQAIGAKYVVPVLSITTDLPCTTAT